MRYIILLLIVLCYACSPEDAEIFDLSSPLDAVKIVELRADHKTLLPDGQAKMEFRVLAYGDQEFTTYTKETVDGQEKYVVGVSRDTFEIPLDRLPENSVKVYDHSGTEVKDMIYSTTEPGEREITFHAEIGNVRSNALKIQIRELPDVNYSEIIVPVIFHVMVPPLSVGPSYEVSSEELQKRLDRLNDIFNRRVTSDPNGGSAKITFKLAIYDPKGRALLEKGKNKVELSEEMTKADYEAYVNSKLIWDPTRYLNVWLAKYSTSSSTANTYSVTAPNVILDGYDAIPGISATKVTSFAASDVKKYTDVGMMINIRDFLQGNTSTFDLSLVFGLYYGLLYTDQDYNNKFVNGDNDYCSDTYVYYSGYYPSVFKSSRRYKENVNGVYEWFTSFNIMDTYTRRNSITVNQAERVRMVVERCPSRWAYKSDWAFTGED